MFSLLKDLTLISIGIFFFGMGLNGLEVIILVQINEMLCKIKPSP